MIELLCMAMIAAILYLFKKLFEPEPIKKLEPTDVLKGYKLFYTDQKVEKKQPDVIYSKILRSQKYDLYGKPDYILRKGHELVPLELKSGMVKESDIPHEGDLMQLIAYFLIIEDLYNTKVKEGRLIYKDAMFIVRNTRSIRKPFFKQLKRMRKMLETGYEKVCPTFMHCKSCVCKDVCEFYNDQS